MLDLHILIHTCIYSTILYACVLLIGISTANTSITAENSQTLHHLSPGIQSLQLMDIGL